MHSGHRERMKKKLVDFGENIFNDHELLELLLFFSIPRKNTNDIAHNLITRFGSFQKMFSADIDSLRSVEGVGISTAIHIKTVGACLARCRRIQKDTRRKLDSVSSVSKFLTELYDNESEERIYLIALNNSFRLLGYSNIYTGKVNFSSTTTDKIVRTAHNYNASFVILAHNHPDGIAIPSQADIDATLKISEAFRHLNVSFLDHFIVAGNRCNSILNISDDSFEILKNKK